MDGKKMEIHNFTAQHGNVAFTVVRWSSASMATATATAMTRRVCEALEVVAKRRGLTPARLMDADVSVVLIESERAAPRVLSIHILPEECLVDRATLRHGATRVCVCVHFRASARSPLETLIICGSVDLSDLRGSAYRLFPRKLVQRSPRLPLWQRARRAEGKRPHRFSLYTTLGHTGNDVCRKELFALVKWRLDALLELYKKVILPRQGKNQSISEAHARRLAREWHCAYFEPYTEAYAHVDMSSYVLTCLALSISPCRVQHKAEEKFAKVRDWYLLAESKVLEIRLSLLLENEEEFEQVLHEQVTFADLCDALQLETRESRTRQLRNGYAHYRLWPERLTRRPAQHAQPRKMCKGGSESESESAPSVLLYAILKRFTFRDDDGAFWVQKGMMRPLYEALCFYWAREAESLIARAHVVKVSAEAEAEAEAEVEAVGDALTDADLFCVLGLEENAPVYNTVRYYRWKRRTESLRESLRESNHALAKHAEELERLAIRSGGNDDDGGFWLNEEAVCIWYRTYYADCCQEAFPLTTISRAHTHRWLATQGQRQVRLRAVRAREDREKSLHSNQTWLYDTASAWPLTRVYAVPFETAIEALWTRDALMYKGDLLIRWYDCHAVFAARMRSETRALWALRMNQAVGELFSEVPDMIGSFRVLIDAIHDNFSKRKPAHSFGSTAAISLNKTPLRKLANLLPPCMADMLSKLKRDGHIKNQRRFPLFTNLLKLDYTEREITSYLRPYWKPAKWAEKKASKNLADYAKVAAQWRRADRKGPFGFGCTAMAMKGLCPFSTMHISARASTHTAKTSCERCTHQCKKKHYRHLSPQHVRRRFRWPISSPFDYMTMAQRAATKTHKKNIHALTARSRGRQSTQEPTSVPELVINKRSCKRQKRSSSRVLVQKE
jgi:hypothetical protein